MKKRILCLLVLLGLGMQAHATVITFDPEDQTISVGDNVSVDLVISGLADDILTSFDLIISFDDTILGFVDFVFGSGLDLYGFGSFQTFFDAGLGELFATELALDDDALLMRDQPNEFVLGTFEFTGLIAGVSALDIEIFELGGQLVGAFPDNFPELLSAELFSGSIRVLEPSPVPEPGTLLLLMSGLLGLRLARPSRAIRA